MPWAGADWQDDEAEAEDEGDILCPVCGIGIDDECRATIKQSCPWAAPVLEPYVS